jgi:cell division septation protein DedD
MAEDFRPDIEDRIAPPEQGEPASSNRRGKRIMTGLVAVAAVLGFGVVLVYAYNKGKQDGTGNTPPVIQAQEGPSKIRPENPGGMNVPNRDKEVFNRLETDSQSSTVERLLPPPEKPMTPPAPPPAAAPEDMAEIAPAAGTEGNVAAPLNPPAAPPTAAPKEIKPLVATPPKAPPVPPVVEKPAAPSGKVAAKTPAPKAKPAAKTPAKPAAKPAANTGAYGVQMASLKSRAAVEKNWAALKRRHTDLLGKLDLNIESVQLSGGRGTYYRMQAGPLASLAQANALCASLKSRKQGCIVVRR